MALPLLARPAAGSCGGVQEYMHRLLHFREQCDFEYVACTMLWLCIDPRRVYRNAEYQSRTKHQWARDDPGFIVAMLVLLATSMSAWSVALGPPSVWSWLAALAYEIVFDFLGLGLVAAAVACLVASGSGANGSRSGDLPGLEGGSGRTERGAESLEFGYAFDVHCNAYFPLFLLLHVVHLCALPLVLADSHASCLLACALYWLALSYYTYLTFLGYNALPFLRNTEVIVLPIGAFALIALAAVVIGFNPSVSSARFFFVPDDDLD